MSITRSTRYKEIHDKTREQFWTPPEGARGSRWWRVTAPKWRRRVGLPRLVAETALLEASDLVRSINSSLFKNDPEMDGRLLALRDELREFAVDFERQNWERFEGKGS